MYLPSNNFNQNDGVLIYVKIHYFSWVIRFFSEAGCLKIS